MSDVMDWNAAYRNEVFFGPPPWNIGEPQPAVAELIRSGKIRSEVLDAGCGVGDASLELQGYTVVGIDVAETAIKAATEAAEQRGLTNVTFVHGDATSLGGYDGRFATILDCTLFHSLPVEARDDYLRAALRAAAGWHDAHAGFHYRRVADRFPVPGAESGEPGRAT